MSAKTRPSCPSCGGHREWCCGTEVCCLCAEKIATHLPPPTVAGKLEMAEKLLASSSIPGARDLIMSGTVPTDAKTRKALPLTTGFLDYFPDACLAVAEVSRIGNEQHNPGEPLHWAKEKSTDEADALARHLLDRGKRDVDGVRHSAKLAWRALALLQREIEAEKKEKDLGCVQMQVGSKL